MKEEETGAETETPQETPQELHETPPESWWDNSKRTKFVECPRAYYYRYVRNLTPSGTSVPLVYGSLVHAILEQKLQGKTTSEALPVAVAELKASYEGQELPFENEFFDDYRSIEQALSLIGAYEQYWKEGIDEWAEKKILSTEQTASFLFDKAVCYSFRYKGKIDLVLSEGTGEKESITVIDHKTTSAYLNSVEKTFTWSPQFMGYWFLVQQKHYVREFVVNLLHTSSRRSKKTGEYGSVKMEFSRVPLIYTPENLKDWEKGLLYDYENFLRCRDTNTYPKCHRSCINQYGRECSYLPLCQQHTSLGEERIEISFIEKEWKI